MEELVAEYLILKNYSTETNVALGSSKNRKRNEDKKRGGGRNEADVLGFKVIGDKLIIVHAECMVQLYGEIDKDYKKIISKFKPKNEKEIEKLAKDRYKSELKLDEKKLFFVVWHPKNEYEELKKKLQKKNKIKLVDFKDLTYCILKAIDEFIEKRKALGLVKKDFNPQAIFSAIPDGLWLLKTIKSLDYVNLIKYDENQQIKCELELP